MFDRYDDACLMNESYVFHTSTSTFSNPIFGTQIVDGADEEEEDVRGDRVKQREDDGHEDERGGDNVETQQPPPSVCQLEAGTRVGSGEKDQAPSADSREKSSCSKSVSHSSCQSEGLSQRWQDFCDNLAFSIKGKLFIMEFNFKRRLRAMRKYLDRKMPRMLHSLSSGGGGGGSHKYHNGDCMLGCNGKSKLRSASKQASNSSSLYTRSSASDLYRRSSSLNNIGKQEQAIGFGCFQFPEPDSAKTLSAQQECLLNRLERIKRDSQKLAQMHRPTLHQGLDGDDGGDDDDDEDDDEIDYIDEDEVDSDSSGNGGHPVVEQRLGNRAAQYRQSTSYVLRAEPSESYATSLAQTAAATNADTVKLGRSITNGSIVAKTTSKPGAKPFGGGGGSSSGSSQPSRGRWISRGGKHIRDTTLAFTGSKRSCIVCYERAPNIVTLPCKHSDICSDCFIEIIFLAVKHSQYPLRCVLCRQKVERIRCSRRLLLNVIEKKRSKRWS